MKKKESKLSVVLDQSVKQQTRKPKSREVSSRFMSPSSPSNSLDIGNPSPIQALSPVWRKPESRKNRPGGQLDDLASLRGLWRWSTTTTTSSSSSLSSTTKFDTLADHLGNDRLNDLLKRKTSVSLDRQRSSREFVNRLENDKDVATTKENHKPIIGGLIRSTRNSRFSAKSSSLSSASKVFNSSEMAPGRFSADENSLFQKPSRRMSDNFTGNMESGSEISYAVSSAAYSTVRKSGIEVSSRYMNDIGTRHRRGTSDSNISDNSPRLGKSTIQKAIKRANSLMGYGSSKSQWALSPGRSDSPPLSVENKGKLMSFSSLKPPNSPSRTKGVEKLLNLGLGLFKTKKSSSSSSSSSSASYSSPSPSLSCNSLPGGYNAAESVHQLRMLHNILMQWRFANAKADAANDNLANQVEGNLISGWDVLTKKLHSVMQKKLQLRKEKLEMKLNFVLQSQLKRLEAWGDMERQHSSAASMTLESLHNAICKVPLIEGAKINLQSASVSLRHALDLLSSIESTLTTFSPSAEETVSLISELANTVAQEKLYLEECLELLRTISKLEIEERSLQCSILQMAPLQNRSTRVDVKDKKSVHEL